MKPMFDDFPDVLTVKDIKRMLQIGTTAAYRLVKQLPEIPIGVQHRYLKVDVIKLVFGNRES